MVTNWRQAVRDILEAAAIFETALAEDLNIHKVVLNRYLNGTRRPKADVVRRINRHVEQLITRRPGIAVFLDFTAMRDGLISVDSGRLAKEMGRTLEGLASRGLLVSDWRERLDKRLDRLDLKGLKALRKGVEAIILASQQPLIDDIIGKTPVTTTSWKPVRTALSRHGLGELVLDPSAFQIELDAFATAVREVLLRPPTTAIDRLGDEAELTVAAMKLLNSAFALPPHKLTHQDLIDLAESIGVNL